MRRSETWGSSTASDGGKEDASGWRFCERALGYLSGGQAVLNVARDEIYDQLKFSEMPLSMTGDR